LFIIIYNDILLILKWYKCDYCIFGRNYRFDSAVQPTCRNQ